MMMTKEECMKALRYITDLYEELYITRLKESGNHIDDTKEYWILEQLINEHFELLEKYTPKKVINRHYAGYVREAYDAYDIYEGICPNCGKQIDSYESEVLCVYCEQRLDWED